MRCNSTTSPIYQCLFSAPPSQSLQSSDDTNRPIPATNWLVCCRSSNRDSHLVFQSPSQAAGLKLRRDPMPTSTQIFLTVLLVALPYGTAIICGAITQWAGRTVSGWCSVGGLALGIYFFHKSMELFLKG